ncbi:protein ALTERED XYLOGLUCAN 9-like [Brassica napus]|uniref:protein ALTERED XYLOGLUCAN 9-like n=1 Tax=Brassica napus TaxID=3708 RepID=UPI00207915E2|nr:protein ALTERED XYLOGLUCAN 9-like [Brassica napus]
MLGAIHFGVLAACFVLFVPMAMAGWHLSRHKMLFFSGALFISLAVCVHLTPYFPSVSDIVASVSSVVVYDHRVSCINEVNQIVWDVKPRPRNSNNGSSKLDYFEKNWDWVRSRKVLSCEFQKLDKFDVSELLNGSWIVIAGDSQARFVALSLLGLVLGSGSEAMGSVREELFKRHSDYSIMVKEIGMKVEFVWAPYEKDLDDLVVSYKKKNKYPDVVIMGSGLWHMLHVNNASDFGSQLKELRSHVELLVPVRTKGEEGGGGSVSGRSMHMFWIGMPVLINGMLNTDEKKEKMSDTVWHEYDRSLGESKILRQMGGPLVLLDVQSFTWNCGPQCTLDGMHYDSAVYDAAVHVMLNALLIESHQTL